MSNKNSKDSVGIENIVKSIITPEDIKNVVQKIYKGSAFVEFNFAPYSEDRLGVLGYHLRLQIVIERSERGSPEILELFVKTLPFDHYEHAEDVKEGGFFQEEIVFYEEILPRFLKNCKSARWCPSVYLMKKNILIMENLKTQGFDVRERFFDETATIKSAMSAVARFHSCSIITQAELNRNSKIDVTLNSFYPNSFKEKAFGKTQPIGTWFFGTCKIIAAVALRLGYEEYHVHRTFERISDIIKPSDKFVNVVCHGDLWSHNLMFDDTQPTPNCILVDFQLIRYCPLALDILQILYLNTTRSFREKSKNELIQYYHSILEETIRNNDSVKDVSIPTFEEILTQVEELKLFGPIVASLFFPAILMNLEGVVQDLQNLEKRIEFLNSDRVNLTLSQMEKDPFFKDRLEEVIGEALELGKRMDEDEIKN
ncbi:hypothetical protein QAD02_016326 [Eretmocerus hayati]|uniref:Uncharacterized protein n=1 Tax=Eretmocerus hayati TaxID=131215 RepID=A0ACC2PD66_9HYME|nr:hypothetical protein QAD02_016326 [Eretmocerus hayati]